MMKEKGIDAHLDYTNLSLERDDDPLPRKFKFPDIRKFTGTEDLDPHLNQYVTNMKATDLTKTQIIKQFSMSLEGNPIRWYYALDPHVQADWKELCVAFMK